MDLLNSSARNLLNIYEEVYDLNLSKGTYEVVYYTENQYIMVEISGLISTAVQYLINNLVYPDDRAPFAQFLDPAEMFKTFEESTRSPSIDLRRLRQDNTYSWIQVLAAQHIDEDGDHHIVLGVIDIHDRKTREEREYNNYFKTLQALGKTYVNISEINLTQNTIRIIKEDLYKEFESKTYCIEEFLGVQMKPLIHPLDTPIIETVVQQLPTIYENNAERTFEARILLTNNSYQWREFHIIAPVRDVTDLDSDKRLLLTLRNISERKLTKSLVDKFIYNNVEFIAFLNLESSTYFIYDENIDDPRPVPLSNEVELLVRKCVKKDMAYVREQLKVDNLREKLIENDNYTFYCDMISNIGALKKKFMFTKPDAHNDLVLFTITDITNIHKQEQEKNNMLVQALKETEVANRAKTDFISRMSHDIRTPMNGVIGMTSVALNAIGDDEKIKDCLQKINTSSQFLLTLINDILDMSKIESGMMTMNNAHFNFREFTNSINTLISSFAASRNVNFELEVDDLLYDYDYVGDSLRLNQVLMNLLSNAIKFTNTNGLVSLKVTTHHKTSEFTSILFTITDTGCGMSKEFMAKMYDPFEQEENDKARNQVGSGLGLAIVNNLTKLMGGTIEVESEIGKGSTFYVQVPLDIAECDNTLTSSTLFDNDLKILIIDDDPVTCEHAQLLLEKISPKIKTDAAHNINDALELLHGAHGFDKIILDWRIPRSKLSTNIEQLTRMSKLDTSSIIMMTAYDISTLKREAKSAGIKVFIPKPLTQEALRIAISKQSAEKSIKQIQMKPASNSTYEGKRILLVDDNNINLEVANSLLTSRKVSVVLARNGQEAVDIFTNAEPGFFDAIFMDIRMPIMDGLTATKAIRNLDRRDAKSITVVGVSADAFQQDINTALQVGMNHYLIKPIVIDQLNELLATLFPSDELI